MEGQSKADRYQDGISEDHMSANRNRVERFVDDLYRDDIMKLLTPLVNAGTSRCVIIMFNAYLIAKS